MTVKDAIRHCSYYKQVLACVLKLNIKVRERPRLEVVYECLRPQLPGFSSSLNK